MSSLADPKVCDDDCSRDGVINLAGTACIANCPASLFLKFICNDATHGKADCLKCSYPASVFTCELCDMEGTKKYLKFDSSGCVDNCTNDGNSNYFFYITLLYRILKL